MVLIFGVLRSGFVGSLLGSFTVVRIFTEKLGTRR